MHGWRRCRRQAEPVVLDEVPDVSERHENSMVARLGAQASFAAALEDDIPISTPSHGYGAHAMGSSRRARQHPGAAAPPMRNTRCPPSRADGASLHRPRRRARTADRTRRSRSLHGTDDVAARGPDAAHADPAAQHAAAAVVHGRPARSRSLARPRADPEQLGTLRRCRRASAAPPRVVRARRLPNGEIPSGVHARSEMSSAVAARRLARGAARASTRSIRAPRPLQAATSPPATSSRRRRPPISPNTPRSARPTSRSKVDHPAPVVEAHVGLLVGLGAAARRHAVT